MRFDRRGPLSLAAPGCLPSQAPESISGSLGLHSKSEGTEAPDCPSCPHTVGLGTARP